MGKKMKRLVEVMDKPHLFGIFRQHQQAEEWQPSKESVREARSLIFTEQDYAETRCGLGSFSPPWLQKLARKEAYLFVYCMVGLVQGMFFSYNVSVISTLEKRFKLTSKQSGAILCGNDISQVILAMLLGYYGNYGHRPRWVGVGVLCAAVSCFLAALPHLIYGPGQDALDLVAAMNAHKLDPLGNATSKAKKMEVCYSNTGESCEGADDGVLSGLFVSSGGGTAYVGPIVLFFISQFFVGISISLFYSIGVTYLDDNVNKKTYPLYYAMTLLLRILGPVLGYLVGGRCLSMWIDPSESPNLSLRDPRWLGAWWLGFVFLGCGLTFVGCLLFLFPRRLPRTLTREAKRVARLAEKEKAQEAAAAGVGMEGVSSRGIEYFASLAKNKREQTAKPTLANLRVALKRIFTNKLWLGNLFNTVVVVFAYSGYWNFKPKYLENQFRKSAAEATYYTGVVSLASVLMGTVLGGIILRWVRPRPYFVAAYNVFITLFVSAGFLTLMFIGCPKLNVVGPVEGSAIPSCSSDCGCSERFSPMCSEDNTTLFYSACYAACTSVDTFANPVVFSGCGCIDNTTTTSTSTTSTISSIKDAFDTSTWPSSLTAPIIQFEEFTGGSEGGGGFGVSGYCPDQCETPFFYYLITQIVVKTVSSTARVGSSVLLLRSVSDEDKGLALGTLTVFMSFFAFIPAPIIMGAIIDSSCVVWDTSCGQTGNCWLYDSDMFRTVLHIVSAAVVLVSVLGDLVVLYYSRQMDLYGEKDDANLELHSSPSTAPTTPGALETPAPPLPSDTYPFQDDEHQQDSAPLYSEKGPARS